MIGGSELLAGLGMLPPQRRHGVLVGWSCAPPSSADRRTFYRHSDTLQGCEDGSWKEGQRPRHTSSVSL